MKNIFDKAVKEEILIRLGNLTIHSKRNWGKMSVTQMMAHLTRSIKIANGDTPMKRAFIGRILAPFFKSRYYNNRPYPKNIKMGIDPYIPDPSLFETKRSELLKIVSEFSETCASKCTSNPHPFFGYFTSEQWGKAVYKHLDHHLKQFSE